MSTKELSQPTSTGWPDDTSKARRVSFRVVSVITALVILALTVIGLVEVVLEWLPQGTLGDIFGEDPSTFILHRTHYMAVGIVSWTLVLTTFAQLRKPWKRAGSLTLLVVVATGATILYGLSGGLKESIGQEGPILIPVLLLWSLHPRRADVLKMPSFDRVAGALAGIAAIPWVVYLFDNASRQLADRPGDPHAEMEHWATAAVLAVAITAGALIGSTDRDGWKLPAWIAAAGSVVFATHTLAYPGLASTLPAFWAILAILWGIVFGYVTITRMRDRDGRTPIPTVSG